MESVMSKTPADAAINGNSEPPFYTLRLHLNAFFRAALAGAPNVPAEAFAADQATGVNGLRRQAAVFALDNFLQLRDASCDCITEDGLYDRLRHGTVPAATRPLISLLYRELSSIGHVAGTTKSTTHVSANGAALPITFSRPRYVIDAFDVFALICDTSRSQLK
jgi:hypothetical protein